MPHKLISAFILVLALSTSALASFSIGGFAGCTGSAKYKITFYNLLTPSRFGSSIPSMGLIFSPLAGASHSGRISVMTVRGFASRAVEEIAEKGDNSRLVRIATRLKKKKLGVKDLAAASGPTMPGKSTTLELEVDCKNSFVTVLGMIAPSPDWIVQISNRNLYSSRLRRFIPYTAGFLIAYDAGTDSGRDFTPPGDLSLDKPTEPKQNIAPLVEDETDRFNGRIIGKYVIRKV